LLQRILLGVVTYAIVLGIIAALLWVYAPSTLIWLGELAKKIAG
jgi:hypothetical protein